MIRKLIGAFVGACVGFILFAALVVASIAAPEFWEWLGPLGGLAVILIVGAAILGWMLVAHEQEAEAAAALLEGEAP